MIAGISEHESLTLSDNRTLSYALYGSPVPRTTLVLAHSNPSSRLEGKLWHAACVTRNIRLIAPDRPGSGLSTFQRNRGILDWTADVLTLLDQLKIHEFYLLGVDGGAAYALAGVWSVGRERLKGVSVVSGVYPGGCGMDLLGRSRILSFFAPWTTGLGTMVVEGLMGRASRDTDPAVFEDVLAREVEKLPSAEQLVLRDPAHWPVVVAMARESFHKGAEGASWEARIHGGDWGFDLANLKVGEHGVPLALWHGSIDAASPASMATRAHDAMSGSVLHMQAGEGHVSYLFRDADAILGELLGEEQDNDDEYIRVGGY